MPTSAQIGIFLRVDVGIDPYKLEKKIRCGKRGDAQSPLLASYLRMPSLAIKAR